MTLAELLTARTTVGATYVAAVAALKDAYIDLASLDGTLANVGNKSLSTFHRDRLQLIEALRQLQHDDFLPSLVANWDAEITASIESRIHNFPTPGA